MRRGIAIVAALVIAGVAFMLWELSQPTPSATGSRAGEGGSGALGTSGDSAEDSTGAEGEGFGRLAGGAAQLKGDDPSLAGGPGQRALSKVSGQVQDAETGAGVGEVEVFFGARNSTVSRPDGSFEIEVPARGYPVTAAGASVLSTAPQRVNARSDVEGVLIPVVRAAIIKGRMIQADRTPVADATVSFSTKTGQGITQGLKLVGGQGTAFTGADGAFELRVVPGTVTVTGRSDLGRAESKPLVAASGKTYSVKISVQPMAAVSGRVVGVDGAPVAGAQVHLHPYGQGVHKADFRITETDAAGWFRIDDAFPGKLAIEAFKEGQGHATPVRVKLRAGKSYESDLRLEPPQSISGQIVKNGRGAEARVRAHRASGRIPLETTTDEAGRFQIDNLAPGKYWLEAWGSDGSHIRTGKVPTPSSGLTVDLEFGVQN